MKAVNYNNFSSFAIVHSLSSSSSSLPSHVIQFVSFKFQILKFFSSSSFSEQELNDTNEKDVCSGGSIVAYEGIKYEAIILS